MTAWFERVDLIGTSDAQRRVIRGVSDLLDALAARRLDRAESVVERERGETWVKLRHDTEPWMSIELVLSDGWVNFYGPMGHDEAYSPRPEPRDSWEAETVDILAELLQSTFTVETYSLGGKPWREIHTVSAPYDRASTELKSLAAVLPLKRWAQHDSTRTASFGCSGSRSV